MNAATIPEYSSGNIQEEVREGRAVLSEAGTYSPIFVRAKVNPQKLPFSVSLKTKQERPAIFSLIANSQQAKHSKFSFSMVITIGTFAVHTALASPEGLLP